MQSSWQNDRILITQGGLEARDSARRQWVRETLWVRRTWSTSGEIQGNRPLCCVYSVSMRNHFMVMENYFLWASQTILWLELLKQSSDHWPQIQWSRDTRMVQVNQTHVQTLIKVKFIIFSGFMDVCPSGNIDRQTIADIYAMPRRWSDIWVSF